MQTHFHSQMNSIHQTYKPPIIKLCIVNNKIQISSTFYNLINNVTNDMKTDTLNHYRKQLILISIFFKSSTIVKGISFKQTKHAFYFEFYETFFLNSLIKIKLNGKIILKEDSYCFQSCKSYVGICSQSMSEDTVQILHPFNQGHELILK